MPEGVKPTGEVHPFADLFPLLGPHDLAAMAETIKQDGLRVPVVVDQHGVLLDGRNRLAACELAGVEPDVVVVATDDPDAYIYDLNIERRHMSTGQRAMVIALRLAQVERDREKSTDRSISNGHRDEPLHKIRDRLVAQAKVSPTLVTRARFVVKHDADNAPNVMSGMTPLDSAHRDAKEKKSARDNESARMAELDRTRPDLAALVVERRLTFAAAWGAYQADRKEFDAECRRTTHNFSESLTMLYALFAAPDDATVGDNIFDHWRDDYVRSADLRPHFDALSADGMREIARRLALMAAKVDAHGGRMHDDVTDDDTASAVPDAEGQDDDDTEQSVF